MLAASAEGVRAWRSMLVASGLGGALVAAAFVVGFLVHERTALGRVPEVAWFVVVVPILEESLKALVIRAYAPARSVRVAAFVGLGFGVAEGVLYCVQVARLRYSLNIVAVLALWRAILPAGMHAGTAVVLTGRPFKEERTSARAFLAAILIHAAYNGLILFAAAQFPTLRL